MINVAIMGFGTVGSGTADVLRENAALIARSAGEEIRLKYILDVRDFPDSPYKSLLTKDFAVIESDPDIRVVAETIGGIGVAYEFTKRCLMAGKSVVTSNKELVAKKGCELLALARGHNANYMFEASVGGGMPIIRPIMQCLAANRIDEIYGIMNGTTNYILTQMKEYGESFENALRDAQEKGFAEADPTADIEGIDAQNKISILSDLCFGRQVNPADVKTRGITGVSLRDVEIAEKNGYRIKLLGRARSMPDGKITAYVEPHLIPAAALISNVSGVMNAIVARGNAIGEAMFYGPGAGSLPTASAVAADILDAARHLGQCRYPGWEPEAAGYVLDPDALESAWYIRAAGEIPAAYAGAHVLESREGECVLITPVMSGEDVKKAAQPLDVRAIYRILD